MAYGLFDSLIDPDRVNTDLLDTFIRQWVLCGAWWAQAQKTGGRLPSCPDKAVVRLTDGPATDPYLYLACSGQYIDYASGKMLTSLLVHMFKAVQDTYPEDASTLVDLAHDILENMKARFQNSVDNVYVSTDPYSEEYAKLNDRIKATDWLRMYKDLYENEEQIEFLACLISAATGNGAAIEFKRYKKQGAIVKRNAIDKMIAQAPGPELKGFLSEAYRHDITEVARHNDPLIKDDKAIYSIQSGQLIATGEEFMKAFLKLLDLCRSLNNLVQAICAEDDVIDGHQRGFLAFSANEEDGKAVLVMYQLWPFSDFEKLREDVSTVSIEVREREGKLNFIFGDGKINVPLDSTIGTTGDIISRLSKGSELLVSIIPVGPLIMNDVPAIEISEGKFQQVLTDEEFASEVRDVVEVES